MIWRRLKNLWRLSAFTVDEKKELKKDFPTVEKKLAKILIEPTNYFEDGETD